MKNVHTLYLIALAGILCFGSSNAQWDERFFPTPSAPLRAGGDFAFDVVASQMVWAVNERYWAVNKSQGWDYFDQYDLQGPRSRFHEPVMGAVKTGLYFIVTSFLDVAAMTNGPNHLVYHSRTGILAKCGLSNDFWSVIPTRNPMGHDWPLDNPSAQKGKDYGWHGIYLILSNLTHTYEGKGFLINQQATEYTFTSDGPLNCSGSTASNFPNTIASYVQESNADDYVARGSYKYTPEEIYESELKTLSGDTGVEAAWLYDTTDAWPLMQYLDAAAERWVQSYSYWTESSSWFSRSDYEGASNACPAVFQYSDVWVLEGFTGATTVLEDGNLLKVGAEASIALPCTAVFLLEYAGELPAEQDDETTTPCTGDLWISGGRYVFSQVVANKRYSHILNWGFRFK
jgi:hypothetical protein